MKKPSKRNKNPIVINPEEGLVFDSEEELFQHFEKNIKDVENFYFKKALEFPKDIPSEEFDKYDHNLDECLCHPDEIWITEKITSVKTAIYIKEIKPHLFHVAFCYLFENQPSFIFMHFPSGNKELVRKFCSGEPAFDASTKDLYLATLQGDALSEEDELAIGHYRAMMMIRSPDDIPQERFKDYGSLREECIECADEIWRNNDSYGQSLVTFIKHFTEPQDIYYIVVTLEEPNSDSNMLLFSFPTQKESLVGRYRQGENLQIDEIINENSH